jgi:hypothetical protein
MEEKGFCMGVALRCKVICRRSRRIPRLTQDGAREWVTVIEAVSGDGKTLRPMVINKGVAHYMGWYANLTKKDLAFFGYSQKGWRNEYLGLKWLKENFQPATAEM